MADGADATDSVRIDRWLLAARLFKTRPLAQAACAGGKVEINRTGASPHKALRVGDRVRVTTPRGVRELVVQALAERRRGATEAALLYEDVTPPAPVVPDVPDPGATLARRDLAAGRPSKRDRRQIARLRGR